MRYFFKLFLVLFLTNMAVIAGDCKSLDISEAMVLENASPACQLKESSFFLLCEQRELEKISNIISSMSTLNFKNEHGSTPLILVCGLPNMSKDLIKILLEHNADVNMQNKYNWTALMGAVEQANVDAVKLLLEYNADIAIQSKHGWTALVRTDQRIIQLKGQLISSDTRYAKEFETTIKKYKEIKLLLESIELFNKQGFSVLSSFNSLLKAILAKRLLVDDNNTGIFYFEDNYPSILKDVYQEKWFKEIAGKGYFLRYKFKQNFQQNISNILEDKCFSDISISTVGEL